MGQNNGNNISGKDLSISKPWWVNIGGIIKKDGASKNEYIPMTYSPAELTPVNDLNIEPASQTSQLVNNIITGKSILLAPHVKIKYEGKLNDIYMPYSQIYVDDTAGIDMSELYTDSDARQYIKVSDNDDVLLRVVQFMSRQTGVKLADTLDKDGLIDVLCEYGIKMVNEKAENLSYLFDAYEASVNPATKEELNRLYSIYYVLMNGDRSNISEKELNEFILKTTKLYDSIWQSRFNSLSPEREKQTSGEILIRVNELYPSYSDQNKKLLAAVSMFKTIQYCSLDKKKILENIETTVKAMSDSAYKAIGTKIDFSKYHEEKNYDKKIAILREIFSVIVSDISALAPVYNINVSETDSKTISNNQDLYLKIAGSGYMNVDSQSVNRFLRETTDVYQGIFNDKVVNGTSVLSLQQIVALVEQQNPSYNQEQITVTSVLFMYKTLLSCLHGRNYLYNFSKNYVRQQLKGEGVEDDIMSMKNFDDHVAMMEQGKLKYVIRDDNNEGKLFIANKRQYSVNVINGKAPKPTQLLSSGYLISTDRSGIDGYLKAINMTEDALSQALYLSGKGKGNGSLDNSFINDDVASNPQLFWSTIDDIENERIKDLSGSDTGAVEEQVKIQATREYVAATEALELMSSKEKTSKALAAMNGWKDGQVKITYKIVNGQLDETSLDLSGLAKNSIEYEMLVGTFEMLGYIRKGARDEKSIISAMLAFFNMNRAAFDSMKKQEIKDDKNASITINIDKLFVISLLGECASRYTRLVFENGCPFIQGQTKKVRVPVKKLVTVTPGSGEHKEKPVELFGDGHTLAWTDRQLVLKLYMYKFCGCPSPVSDGNVILNLTYEDVTQFLNWKAKKGNGSNASGTALSSEEAALLGKLANYLRSSQPPIAITDIFMDVPVTPGNEIKTKEINAALQIFRDFYNSVVRPNIYTVRDNEQQKLLEKAMAEENLTEWNKTLIFVEDAFKQLMRMPSMPDTKTQELTSDEYLLAVKEKLFNSDAVSGTVSIKYLRTPMFDAEFLRRFAEQYSGLLEKNHLLTVIFGANTPKIVSNPKKFLIDVANRMNASDSYSIHYERNANEDIQKVKIILQLALSKYQTGMDGCGWLQGQLSGVSSVAKVIYGGIASYPFALKLKGYLINNGKLDETKMGYLSLNSEQVNSSVVAVVLKDYETLIAKMKSVPKERRGEYVSYFAGFELEGKNDEEKFNEIILKLTHYAEVLERNLKVEQFTFSYESYGEVEDDLINALTVYTRTLISFFGDNDEVKKEGMLNVSATIKKLVGFDKNNIVCVTESSGDSKALETSVRVHEPVEHNPVESIGVDGFAQWARFRYFMMPIIAMQMQTGFAAKTGIFLNAKAHGNPYAEFDLNKHLKETAKTRISFYSFRYNPVTWVMFPIDQFKQGNIVGGLLSIYIIGYFAMHAVGSLYRFFHNVVNDVAFTKGGHTTLKDSSIVGPKPAVNVENLKGFNELELAQMSKGEQALYRAGEIGLGLKDMALRTPMNLLDPLRLGFINDPIAAGESLIGRGVKGAYYGITGIFPHGQLPEPVSVPSARVIVINALTEGGSYKFELQTDNGLTKIVNAAKEGISKIKIPDNIQKAIDVTGRFLKSKMMLNNLPPLGTKNITLTDFEVLRIVTAKDMHAIREILGSKLNTAQMEVLAAELKGSWNWILENNDLGRILKNRPEFSDIIKEYQANVAKVGQEQAKEIMNSKINERVNAKADNYAKGYKGKVKDFKASLEYARQNPLVAMPYKLPGIGLDLEVTGKELYIGMESFLSPKMKGFIERNTLGKVFGALQGDGYSYFQAEEDIFTRNPWLNEYVNVANNTSCLPEQVILHNTFEKMCRTEAANIASKNIEGWASMSGDEKAKVVAKGGEYFEKVRHDLKQQFVAENAAYERVEKITLYQEVARDIMNRTDEVARRRSGVTSPDAVAGRDYQYQPGDYEIAESEVLSKLRASNNNKNTRDIDSLTASRKDAEKLNAYEETRALNEYYRFNEEVYSNAKRRISERLNKQDITNDDIEAFKKSDKATFENIYKDAMRETKRQRSANQMKRCEKGMAIHYKARQAVLFERFFLPYIEQYLGIHKRSVTGEILVSNPLLAAFKREFAEMKRYYLMQDGKVDVTSAYGRQKPEILPPEEKVAAETISGPKLKNPQTKPEIGGKTPDYLEEVPMAAKKERPVITDKTEPVINTFVVNPQPQKQIEYKPGNMSWVAPGITPPNGSLPIAPMLIPSQAVDPYVFNPYLYNFNMAEVNPANVNPSGLLEGPKGPLAVPNGAQSAYMPASEPVNAIVINQTAMIFATTPLSTQAAFDMFGLNMKTATLDQVKTSFRSTSFKVAQDITGLPPQYQQNLNAANELCVNYLSKGKIQLNNGNVVDKSMLDNIKGAKWTVFIMAGVILAFDMYGNRHLWNDKKAFLAAVAKDCGRDYAGLVLFSVGDKAMQQIAMKTGFTAWGILSSSVGRCTILGAVIGGIQGTVENWDQMGNIDNEKRAAGVCNLVDKIGAGAAGGLGFGLAALAGLTGGTAVVVGMVLGTVTYIIYQGGRYLVYNGSGWEEANVSYNIEKELNIKMLTIDERKISPDYREVLGKKAKGEINYIKSLFSDPANKKLLTDRFSSINLNSPYFLSLDLLNYIMAEKEIHPEFTGKKVKVTVALDDMVINGDYAYPRYIVTFRSEDDSVVKEFRFIDSSRNITSIEKKVMTAEDEKALWEKMDSELEQQAKQRPIYVNGRPMGSMYEGSKYGSPIEVTTSANRNFSYLQDEAVTRNYPKGPDAVVQSFTLKDTDIKIDTKGFSKSMEDVSLHVMDILKNLLDCGYIKLGDGSWSKEFKAALNSTPDAFERFLANRPSKRDIVSWKLLIPGFNMFDLQDKLIKWAVNPNKRIIQDLLVYGVSEFKKSRGLKDDNILNKDIYDSIQQEALDKQYAEQKKIEAENKIKYEETMQRAKTEGREYHVAVAGDAGKDIAEKAYDWWISGVLVNADLDVKKLFTEKLYRLNGFTSDMQFKMAVVIIFPTDDEMCKMLGIKGPLTKTHRMNISKFVEESDARIEFNIQSATSELSAQSSATSRVNYVAPQSSGNKDQAADDLAFVPIKNVNTKNGPLQIRVIVK